jgi:predicted transcriptional regulator
VHSFTTEKTVKRRDKLSIIAEILEIAKGGTLKTRIMYSANLSFVQLNAYLKFMLQAHLIDKFVYVGKEVYQATEKGLDFLQRRREIVALLETEDEKRANNVRVPLRKQREKY